MTPFIILGALIVALAVLVQGVVEESKQGDCQTPEGGDSIVRGDFLSLVPGAPRVSN